MYDKSSARAIMGYDTVNDRILSVRFRGKETTTTIIQIYAPTSTTEEENTRMFLHRYAGEVRQGSKRRHFGDHG